jgi:hypothetical protein
MVRSNSGANIGKYKIKSGQTLTIGSLQFISLCVFSLLISGKSVALCSAMSKKQEIGNIPAFEIPKTGNAFSYCKSLGHFYLKIFLFETWLFIDQVFFCV